MIVLLFISVILQCISISTNHWSKISDNNLDIKGGFNYGLYEFCGIITKKTNSYQHCMDTEEGKVKFTIYLLRFLAILNIISLILAIYLSIFNKNNYIKPLIFFSILSIILIIGLWFTKINSNFKYETGSTKVIKPGYSIFLYIFSVILLCIYVYKKY